MSPNSDPLLLCSTTVGLLARRPRLATKSEVKGMPKPLAEGSRVPPLALGEDLGQG